MAEYLQCDAEGCTHNETVTEINEALVGKPCPLCGASLLTSEDFEFWIKKVKPMHSMMMAAGLIAEPTEAERADGSNILSVHYHDGEMTVKAKV